MLNHVASQIIILKCVVSNTDVYYIEIDTGARTFEMHTAGNSNYNIGLDRIAPKTVMYELGVALRFCNSAAEAIAALTAMGWPQKLKVELLREVPIAQRLTIDLFPNTEETDVPLAERKARRKPTPKEIADVVTTAPTN